MNFEKIKNYLGWIIPNDDIKTKLGKNIFLYNTGHPASVSNFINEAKINIKYNTDEWFNTVQDLAKMGNMIFINIPNINNLCMILPSGNKLSNTQLEFLNLIDKNLYNFDDVAISFYNDDINDFINNYYSKEDIEITKKHVKTIA